MRSTCYESPWELNVSKEDFKQRLKAGDVDAEIAKAQQMLISLHKGEDPFKSARYKDATKDDKIDWLKRHIMQLTNATEQVSEEKLESQEDKFIGDHFDIKKDEEDKVSLPEPLKNER